MTSPRKDVAKISAAAFTVFTNASDKPLSKSFSFEDGKLVGIVAAQMNAGNFETLEVETIDDFGALLLSGRYSSNSALAYGVNLARRGYVASQEAIKAGQARPGAVARTKENFAFRAGQPGVWFGDIDPLPGNESENAYHYDKQLTKVVPWWFSWRRIIIESSSSGIYHGDELVSRKAAYHAHGLLDDASQAKAITDAIFAACVDEGLGRAVILKNGAVVLRTIIDRAVSQGERLDFGFGAKLMNPLLTQERRCIPKGEIDLLETDGKGLHDFDGWRRDSSAARDLLRGAEREAKAARGRFIDEKVEEAAGRGMDRDTVRRNYQQAFSRDALPPEHVIYFANVPAVTVGEIHADPARYHGLTCRDPWEPDYAGGSAVGIVYTLGQAAWPVIHSQAHGGGTHRLMPYEPSGKTTSVGTVSKEPAPGAKAAPPLIASDPKTEARPFAAIIQEVQALAGKGYEAFERLTVDIPTEMAAGDYRPAEVDAIFRAIGKAARCSPASVRKVYTAAKASVQVEKTGGESLDLAVARRVRDDHYRGGDDAIASKQGLRVWNGSYWEQQDDILACKQIVAAAEEMGAADQVRKALVESSRALLSIELSRNPEVQFNPDLGSTFINVANGELHLVGDRWELRPAKREHYRTSQIPVAYDPRATCPTWVAFLDSIFRGDDDAAEKRQCLMQMFGYSLLTITAYDRFAMLIGAGSNGKSVVLNVLRALLGRKNVSAVQPSQLDNRFQRAHLLDKLANIVSEVKRDTLLPDETIKKLVSGDLDTAEHKHKPPFDFCNHATIWLGMNALPKVDDFSDGLFRRASILTFNRSFGVKGQPVSATSHRLADEDANPALRLIERGEGPLAGELPGILNMALRSIIEFMQAGRIASPPSGDAMLREWHMNNDQVASFVAEECVLGPHYEMPSSEFYQHFLGWTKAQGIIVPVTQTAFSLGLKTAAPITIAKSTGTMKVRGICTRADRQRQDANAQRLEAQYAA
jgi:putative DNA primase/helicase